MKRKTIPILGLLFVLLAAACGGATTETAGETTTQPSDAPIMTVYWSPT